MEQQQGIDAYRYFFPAGWLLGIWGVVLWILFPWSLVSYPGLRHPEIMMGGFFLCFVCGFLMTAAPRFTATHGPTVMEQRLSWLLIGLLFLSLFPQSRLWFFLAVNLMFLSLTLFMVRRFLVRKNNPPDAFVFVGFGLLVGLAGSLIMTLSEFFDTPSIVYQMGRLFFLQTYILSLVLGVGSRLIPALLGWAPLPTESKAPPKVIFFITLGVLFLVSYVMEAFSWGLPGNILRTLIVLIISLRFWKIHRFPQRRGVQTFWLWSAAWMLLLGQGALIFFPDFRVHILHVIFASGLSLMTLMIAVRVALSHGKHELSLEKNSKALLAGGFLVLFAGLTRLSAGFAPEIYQSHLVYAAFTWVFGLLIWGWVYIPRILSVRSV